MPTVPGNLQPSTHHITHVWHTADPIAMGTCNGVLSSCSIGGYAMESRCEHSDSPRTVRAFFSDAILRSCHLGDIIEYDTVSNKSWNVDLRTHAIAQVVDKLLSEPWPPAEECGREVPALKRQDDCLVSSSLLPFHTLAPTE